MVSQLHSFLAPWWNPDPAVPRDGGQWWSEPKLECCTLVHTCACKHTHSGHSPHVVCPSSLSPLEVLHIFPLPGAVWSNSQVPSSEIFFVIKVMLRTVAGTWQTPKTHREERIICFFTSRKHRLDHLFLRGGNMMTWFKIQVIEKDLQGKFFASLTPYLSYSPPVVLNFLSILQIYICICWPICVCI